MYPHELPEFSVIALMLTDVKAQASFAVVSHEAALRCLNAEVPLLNSDLEVYK